MKSLLLIILLSTCFAVEAKMYLEFSISNRQDLQTLDEALQLGQKLRNSLASLEKHAPDDANVKVLREQIEKFDVQMYKTYGMIPGLTYHTVPTSGIIYILIPENKTAEFIKQGFTITAETPSVAIKNDQETIKCFKVEFRKLSKREDVLTFNKTLKAAQEIRRQIDSLKQQISAKPEMKENINIQQGMQKLEETLKILDDELNKSYNVTPNHKFLFEPTAGEVYLELSEEDLIKLGTLKNAPAAKEK